MAAPLELRTPMGTAAQAAEQSADGSMATMALRTSRPANEPWNGRDVAVRQSEWSKLCKTGNSLMPRKKRAVRCAGLLPASPHQGGGPPGPPGPFPFFAMFQNGPRRQGFAAPRKKRAPLTAAGRSENPTEIRERGLVRNGPAASLPLVGILAERLLGRKITPISLLTPTGLLMEAANARGGKSISARA